jgi:hypothetical protein
VNANPVVSINGVVDSIQGPFYSSTRSRLPWIAYQLSRPVSAQDVVTWTTPDGWCETINKKCAAEAGKADNWAGQLEPGVFGYLAFSDTTRTLKAGFGLQGGVTHNTCPVKDIIHRADNPWRNAVTSTPDGYPLTINGSGFTITSLWNTNDANYITNGGFPTPIGTWVVMGDETQPASPMAVSLTSGTSPASIGAAVITPGRMVDGVERDKTWSFTVTRGPKPNLSLGLRLTTPNTKAGPNTLTNLRAFEPGNVPTPNPSLLPSDNYIYQMTAAPGVYSPLMRVLWGYGTDSTVGPGDLPGERFSYADPPRSTTWTTKAPTFTGDRVIPIHSVRRYDPAVSPYVYGSAPYKRFSPVTQGYGAFQLKLADHNFGYDWIDPSAPLTRQVVAEFFVADSDGNPINHNLQSGQFLSLPASTIKVANSAGTGTINIAGIRIIWVTSPNTFIAELNSSLKPTPKLAWVDDSALQVLNKQANFSLSQRGWPIEFLGAASKALGNNAVWLGVNHALSDAGIRSVATRVYQSTNRGTKVYVQYSNEILIPNYQFGWNNQLARLEGLTPVQACVQRMSEVHKIFTDVWGDDAKSLVRVFQPWTVADNTTHEGLAYAQANRIPIDAIAIAPYIDMDESPPFVMAAASICADDTRSVAFGKPVLPMAAYHDLLRHNIKYHNFWNGPTGAITKTYNQIARTHYGTGPGFTYPTPKIIFYECAYSALIPSGVSKTHRVVRTGLTHDAIYHPSYYQTIQAFLQFCQQPGPSGTVGADAIVVASLVGGRSYRGNGFKCTDGDDSIQAAVWTTYCWQGQPRGPGTSNRFWATALGGDGGIHDDLNQSVSGQSYADWIVGAAASASRQ